MLTTHDVDTTLELAKSLCRTSDTPDVGAGLLEPVGSLIGAEMAAFREISLRDTEPKVGRHASVGVPERLHNQYLEKYYKLDPAIFPPAPRTGISRPFANRAEVSRCDSSSYTSLGQMSDAHRRYVREFLAANQLLNNISMHFCTGERGRLFLLDFHRPSSSTAFSDRDFMIAQMMCPAVQLLLTTLAGRREPAGCQEYEHDLFEFDVADTITHTTDFRLNGPVECLTERERAVVAAVMKGLSNKEVARHLGISVRTAENHLRKIYSKCGVHSRSQLASKLIGFAN